MPAGFASLTQRREVHLERYVAEAGACEPLNRAPVVESFYTSWIWRKCRRAFAESKGNLCEICLSKGLVKPGEIVHHKIHLDPDNIHDPDVALNWDNLQLVCRDCHALIHRPERRFKVDEWGRVISF